ncbi:flagellar motor switch protein FliN [Piscirickettsia salmonis]|uniref:flagellar motor switch protein FliN n=1 Tax=Piscirickettsia salmonis TaxID=1238 RepID=UPI0007C8F03E|nr:Flagellar motor switch protein FliN [Piscirickettsiaceae bacterium NZ-RLO1]
MSDDENKNDDISWDEAFEESGDAQSDDDVEAAWGAALEESGDAEGQDELETLNTGFDPVALASEEYPDLEKILDLPVTISMQVGGANISIRNLLQLNQGSVVELDRYAGEPLDVRVNGTLVAHGEVVVVNEKYGIRLTDVISAAERLQKLK